MEIIWKNSNYLQTEDDGGGGLEDDDYDALNDETFGEAINGDWEAIHDTLVELDQNGNTNGADSDDNHDADIADLGKQNIYIKNIRVYKN